jgi:hypothetical protein
MVPNTSNACNPKSASVHSGPYCAVIPGRLSESSFCVGNLDSGFRTVAAGPGMTAKIDAQRRSGASRLNRSGMCAALTTPSHFSRSLVRKAPNSAGVPALMSTESLAGRAFAHRPRGAQPTENRETKRRGFQKRRHSGAVLPTEPGIQRRRKEPGFRVPADGRPRNDDKKPALNRSESSLPSPPPAISPVPWRERRRIRPGCRP